MITTRHMSVEVELVRWLLLVAAAVALVLAIASALAAADPMPMAPGLLPDDMGTTARPLAPAPLRPFFPEDPPIRDMPPAEAAVRLSLTLDHQRAGSIADALAGWEQIRLPAETAHWREIAIGAASLRVGDRERALTHLDNARQLAPDHPVVAYFMGVLRMEQAAAVGRLPDRPSRGHLLLVASGPFAERAYYQSLAIAELQQAIAGADEVVRDERLLKTDPQLEEAVVVPRVGDLLMALGADNFVRQAHHLLFGLHLDRAEPAKAEIHLDRAAAMGAPVLYGYQDLAEAYLDVGHNTDAIRAAGKDLKVNQPWLPMLCERLGEMWRDAGKADWVW